eukprot:1265056-Ditylum_brightwellii.AAC.1
MDSASSINIISQKLLLHGIFKLNKDQWIPIITVGKEIVYLKYKGYLGDYPEPAWYYPQGSANIMSLYNVKKYYCITMDTAANDAFYMHLSNSDRIRIRSARKGIYTINKHPSLSSKDIWTKKMVDNDHPCP